MTTLILIRGIPGSGKSTLAKLLAGYEHYENDQFFEQPDGSYAYDPSQVKAAAALCLARTADALSRGANVVVSNTFSRSWEYAPYHALAAQYGIPVQMVVCQGDFGSIHDIPPDRMARFREEFHFTSTTG